MDWFEFELVYFEFAVQHFSYYVTGTFTDRANIKERAKINKKSLNLQRLFLETNIRTELGRLTFLYQYLLSTNYTVSNKFSL